MATLLAPLAPISNVLLPLTNGHTSHTHIPNQSDTAATPTPTPTPTPPATSTSPRTAISTAPNRDGLGTSLSKNGSQGVILNNATAVTDVSSALNTPARVTGPRDMTMQTVSTQTDNNELQRERGTKFFATTELYAAHYLRTAEAHELPSYPTIGLLHPEVAGASAALLAHRDHRPVEIWRPNFVAAAGAAASLAHSNPKSVNIWEPAPSEPAGKAALHALEDHSFPQPYTMPESFKRWSLSGAIGAMQISKEKRRRSGSSPMPYTIRQETEAANARNSALTAATIAHMPPIRRLSVATGADPTSEYVAESKVLNADRVPQQDKRKSDVLRAATISMSKSSRRTTLPDVPIHDHSAQSVPVTPPSRRFGSNMQEAARKVAAERLAKIGYDNNRTLSASPLEAQTSINRSYTVPNAGSSDIGQARNTGAEMTLLRGNIARADEKKRGENAVLLMSTAQRNVRAKLSGIDKQVADSRGLTRREDWEPRVTQIAQADSEKRTENHGKISMGGGAYMAPEEIDAIAQRNIQPLLEDINRRANAEKARIDFERARGLEEHLDIEESKRVQALHQARERETREDIRRAKAIEKGDEKRRKEEEKRAVKGRRQPSKIDSKGDGNLGGLGDNSPISPTSPLSDSSSKEGRIRGLFNRFRRRQSRQISHDEKEAVAISAPIGGTVIDPTFSGGHAAIYEQQHVNEASGDRIAFNGSPRPESAFRIPRRISSIIVPKSNGAPQEPVAMRSVSAAGNQPIRTDGGDKTPVKRRHSLSSIGAGGYYFKGRRRTEDPATTDDQGTKKGKGKLLRKRTKDFAKINGRISSTEDHSEYPDEARDTFSQQSPTFPPTNRASGFFPHDERRFSGGEGSVSSRFREDL